MRFVDDLDGSEASGTINFGLDGRRYEIDLSEDNAGKLRDALAPFVGDARKSGGGSAGRGSRGGGGQRKTVPVAEKTVSKAEKSPARSARYSDSRCRWCGSCDWRSGCRP